MRGSRHEKTGKNKRDEVEELLQAAQDQLLLNLSLNSHIARPSASASADLDLERRFQALKSSWPYASASESDRELKTVLGDDLSARFAALKRKSSTSIASKQVSPAPIASASNCEDEEDDEEDQVENLIQRAKDAARLDPFPPSDDDDDDDNDDEEHKMDNIKSK